MADEIARMKWDQTAAVEAANRIACPNCLSPAGVPCIMRPSSDLVFHHARFHAVGEAAGMEAAARIVNSMAHLGGMSEVAAAIRRCARTGARVEADAPRDRLTAAIRRFTVDARDEDGNLCPNGPAEEVMEELAQMMDDPLALKSDVAELLARYCESLADDTQELREAAEGYFGGDFRASGESQSPPDPRGEAGEGIAVGSHTAADWATALQADRGEDPR